MSPMFFGSPEEIVAMHDRQEMIAESRRLAVEQLLETATPEQLASIKYMMETTIHDKKGQYASYISGVITSILQHKHHRCPSCGGEHGIFSTPHIFGDNPDEVEAHKPDVNKSDDDEEPKMGWSPIEVSIDIPNPNPEFIKAIQGMDEPLLNPDGSIREEMLPGPMENLQEKLDLYEVELVEPDAPNGGVRCKNCGFLSVSLEDRMLRRPGTDGCGSCQIRSAHG